jgi:hypothetical protein
MGGKGSEGIINLRRNPPLIPSFFLMIPDRGCMLPGLCEGMEQTTREKETRLSRRKDLREKQSEEDSFYYYFTLLKFNLCELLFVQKWAYMFC